MKLLTDRRQSIEAQIQFYQTQARLAQLGLNTRRSEAFYQRQVAYLQEFGR
jgi:hypothetical protein